MTTNPFKIAILDDFERIAETVPAYAKLSARADITLLRERLDSSEKIVQRLRDFDALLLMRERTFLSDKEYGQLPNLKFISQTGRTSVHLDLANATKRGIAVAGTAGDTGATTKELTIGLILALARKIPQVNQRMREELWPALTGMMLEGKTIGVLGLGRIGNEVARIMKAFNTRVLGWSRSLTPERAAEVGAEAVPMETLLKESDFVTVHVHYSAQTVNLIGAKEIALMKRGAFLVNTGRGPIINETAMLDGLASGHLGGVGLDVYDKEPLPMDHPLRRFDNAILMSHRGYATVEILSERYEQAINNLLDYLDDKPTSLINKDVQVRRP
ncbi:MAG TPA: D-2-hydroxyacid dehydrogenase family protein [Candidatus Binatia bacterium]|nr:D-2-hydroxyacid dehydrogenase family protein [Candidatus Binatia bacterium]